MTGNLEFGRDCLGVDLIAGINMELDGVDLMVGGGWFPVQMGVSLLEILVIIDEVYLVVWCFV